MISLSCSTSHTPIRSCELITRSQSEKVSLSEMTLSLLSSLVTSVYHFLSGAAYSSCSTASSAGSCICFVRNWPDVSRLARGRMMSLSTLERHAGTGSVSSLLPNRPCRGLHRQKEMRISMPMNSYSTSS